MCGYRVRCPVPALRSPAAFVWCSLCGAGPSREERRVLRRAVRGRQGGRAPHDTAGGDGDDAPGAWVSLIGRRFEVDRCRPRQVQQVPGREVGDEQAGPLVEVQVAERIDSIVPPASEEVRRALCHARQVIQAVAEQPSSPQALEAFNGLLTHGRRQRVLTAAAPLSRVVVDSPKWMVPWLAADEYVDLLLTRPDRIKRCMHPECVLWYLDTSRSGTRRWCSMSVCGNRTKATRHYQRQTG